jgi:hypothetical protein
MTAKGGADTPRPDSSPDGEVGGFHDNASVLAIASWRIDNGSISEGLAMLYRLKDHIAAIDDQKSRIILLPAVEKATERAYRRQQALDQSDDAARPVTTPASAATTSASDGLSTGHGDLTGRVKSHLIDAVGLVTALFWTQHPGPRDHNAVRARGPSGRRQPGIGIAARDHGARGYQAHALAGQDGRQP